MVINHPYGLHKGIADRRSHEAKAAFLQVFAHGDGFRRCSDIIRFCLQRVDNRLAADKSPQIFAERAEFLFQA